MKKYLFIMMAAVLTGCSSNNYDGLPVAVGTGTRVTAAVIPNCLFPKLS